MTTNNTMYHTEGVIAFVPNDIETPDVGMIGVYVKEEKDRLFFYPWLPAMRSKSDHVLATPVTRIDPTTWRLHALNENMATDWFDPLVLTNESPVRLRRVAKTKARTLATQSSNDWDNLEYADDHEPVDSDDSTAPSGNTTASKPPSTAPSSTTTVAAPALDTLKDSSVSSPQA